MRSYWENDAWLQYDYIVVGAGIIGLSTAISLKELAPKSTVLVLERGLIPSGASTRNAGFACFGSLTEILYDMKQNGEEATVALVRARYEGLQMLRKRLGDKACGYEQHGGYELLFSENRAALDQIDLVNAALRDIFAAPVFVQDKKAFDSFGFNNERVKALVRSEFEGQIHSGIMMRSLTQYAQEHGITILFGADVESIQENSEQIELTVTHGKEHLLFRASELALCTNAFTSEFAPELGIVPGRGQVLITEPVPNLPFRGVFHFDEGFYYFRNVSSPQGERILFGGGRNLAFEAEQTADLSLNETIQQELERLLCEVIIPGEEVRIAERWSGIMGFHSSKLPIVRRIRERVSVGFGCNGMGVALGSTIGAETAKCVLA